MEAATKTELDGGEPRRRLGRKRRPVPHRRSLFAETAMQVFSVVLGILLAVGVDHWRQGLKDRQLVRESQQAIRREMTGNQARMQKSIQYHLALGKALDGVVQRHSRDKVITLEELESFMQHDAPEGLGGSFAAHIAWDIAVTAQAPALMDYKTSALLSGVYRSQQSLEDQERHMGETLLNPQNLEPTRLYYTLVVIEAGLENTRFSEAETLRLYGSALQQLQARRP